MNKAVLSLGSNVGERGANLEKAILLLQKLPCSVIKKSSVYKTAPWGNTHQPAFYNQVLEVETNLEADELLKAILHTEKSMGRTRTQKWEPRIIDIDILFFNDMQINAPMLTVPHPHLHERRFVLKPLAEILPEKIHPVFMETVSQLLHELRDDGSVEKIK